jgi:hypothetical protein
MTRRIEVEIARLVVEDPALARPGALATAIEAELARDRSPALGRDPALRGVAASVADSIRKALPR